jgi:long-subunit fatty acid transport protein
MAIAVSLCLVPTVVQAGPIGSMFSGSTAEDAAVSYYNPASMTLLKGTHSLMYVSLATVTVTHQRDTPSAFDGTYYPQAQFQVGSPDPYLGLVTDFGLRKWRFGLSVGLPWADGAGWEPTYQGRPASTRYHGLKPVSGQLFIGPSVAYQINRYVSLGFGVDIIAGFINHEFMIDFAPRVNQLLCGQAGAATCTLNTPHVREKPPYQGRLNVDAFGWGVGVAAGVLIRPLRWLRLATGVHTNAGRMNLSTDIAVRVPPGLVEYMANALPGVTPSAIKGQADLEYGMPIIVTAGVSALPGERTELAFDFHWMSMSDTSTTVTTISQTNSALLDDLLLIRGRRNHYQYALRGTYRILNALTIGLRLTYSSNTRPEEFVTPTSFDTWKVSIFVGLIWKLTRWMDLIVEYGHFFLGARDITVSRYGPKAYPMTPAEQGFDNTSPTGHYEATSDRGGLGFRLHF